ncbi:urocanate hydratase [Propionibacterium cyclohexanicum]|uniref:Urocanate hydratase n=1 Tax=Propionibacterium cyclohexanicum TaxID=64702 RepID=A0A1H9SNM5_9ACTN|nr:urocanate hydratase [Propionibacterium cyclohexanicum]SER86478.1 urocanate hydratase [Propionibacterium cyclohexanicum]
MTTSPLKRNGAFGPITELPARPGFVSGVRRAPSRGFRLSRHQTELALRNALRYIDPSLHEQILPEFLDELHNYGRIYGYRFRPSGRIWGRPISQYPGQCLEGRAFQVMIDNNLDFEVGLYPYELVTYGETGAVCQNWMQYRLISEYLQEMTDHQTLVVESGHPLGLFASQPDQPRVTITNGLLIGEYDNLQDWEIAAQMGVTNYGQMTAGGWMYIGPQGIVHGTYNTLLNAGRLELGIAEDSDLRGKLFVSSGLGGMSGAQPKAMKLAGGVALIAEVDPSRIKTRLDQGWVDEAYNDLTDAVSAADAARAAGQAKSIAYEGNIVDLLGHLVEHHVAVDLFSDQTSCHAAYAGGYCPEGITFEQRGVLLRDDPQQYRELVDKTLRHHIELVETLVASGAYFFDYGNAFLKAVFDAGVTRISRNGVDDKEGFILPSYVEDIMGPHLFDYGYGPFRWVCLSGLPEDLAATDRAAMECIDPGRRYQDRDNYNWIKHAREAQLVVGTQARILYQDAAGRVAIAKRFNELVRKGTIGPVMIGRDHHDVSGTDSPFRETSNVRDGSNVAADMAVQCYVGNAARGMSLVALHNGGGVGVGKAINGGFGLVLDGSERVDTIIENAMSWDVMGGVARRAWARNQHSIEVGDEFNETQSGTAHITIPALVEDQLIDAALRS